MALRIVDAIDMHCHFGPDTIGGPAAESGGGRHSVTGLDAAREALASGHRAIVLKSHSFASPAVAAHIEQATPGLRVFGGICTDYPSGGLNVDAVAAALHLGARIVWLPTVHSHQEVLNGKAEWLGIRDGGIHVLDAAGSIVEEVRAIIDLVRRHGAILATGHTTAAEHYAVVKAFAREVPVLVTHAGEHMAGPGLTAEQCRELADLGATIELTALTCGSHPLGVHGKSIAEMVAMIRTVGVERCTLSSDYGWTDALPHPAAGLHAFLEQLWDAGLTEDQLTTMVSRAPARLLRM